MVFMTVGDEERLDLLLVADQMGVIRNNVIDT